MNSQFSVCFNLMIETIIHNNLDNTQHTAGIIVGTSLLKSPAKL